MELDIEVADDALEVSFIENLFALGDTEEESAAAKIVDPASDAFGVIVDSTDKAIAKDLSLGTGDTEMVFDVASGFFDVEGRDVETDSNTLVEGTCPVRPSTGPQKERNEVCWQDRAGRGERER